MGTALLFSFLMIMGSVGVFLPPIDGNLAENIEPSTADVSSSPNWNTTWGGPDGDWTEAVVADGAGDVYVAGYGKGWKGTEYDVWVGKYSATGVLLWNTTWGGPNDDFAYGIAVDAAGNAYLAGYTLSWHPPGFYDIWVGKFSATGSLLWNRTWDSGFGSMDIGLDVTVDATGNAYICGYTTISTSQT